MTRCPKKSRMRELHLKLRTMSTTDSTCADSDRYPFLKEFIKLDKKLHDNWNVYDHFVANAEMAESAESAEEVEAKPKAKKSKKA